MYWISSKIMLRYTCEVSQVMVVYPGLATRHPPVTRGAAGQTAAHSTLGYCQHKPV